MEDEVQQEEVRKNQKGVSGVVSQITGVESIHKRRVFVRSAVELDILSGRFIARSTEHQGGGNQVFKGEGDVVVVQQEEVVMGDTVMEIKRSRVMQKCYLARCTWAWETRMGRTRSGCVIQGPTITCVETTPCLTLSRIFHHPFTSSK